MRVAENLDERELSARIAHYGPWLQGAQMPEELGVRIYAVLATFVPEGDFARVLREFWEGFDPEFRTHFDAVAAPAEPRLFGKDAFWRTVGRQRELALSQVKRAALDCWHRRGGGSERELAEVWLHEGLLENMVIGVAKFLGEPDDEMLPHIADSYVRSLRALGKSKKEIRASRELCTMANLIEAKRRFGSTPLGQKLLKADAQWRRTGLDSDERSHQRMMLLDEWFASRNSDG
jgi:hypothetical protein